MTVQLFQSVSSHDVSVCCLVCLCNLFHVLMFHWFTFLSDGICCIVAHCGIWTTPASHFSIVPNRLFCANHYISISNSYFVSCRSAELLTLCAYVLLTFTSEGSKSSVFCVFTGCPWFSVCPAHSRSRFCSIDWKRPTTTPTSGPPIAESQVRPAQSPVVANDCGSLSSVN